MWPDDQDLPIKVEAAFGADLAANPTTWTWTDLSTRLRGDLIRLRAGKSSGSREVSPGSCTVTLDNDDAALTPVHPMSPWWPNVEVGTPLRVSVQWAGVWHERFAGTADQWEPTYTPTGVVGVMSSAVRVTASGILRRLGQGTQPTLSAMRRATPLSNPVAYWPCEEGGDATSAASAIPGHPPITVVGEVDFAELSIATPGGNAAIGSLPLPDVSAGGSLVARLPAAATAACTAAGQWTVGLMTEVEVGAHTGDMTLLEWLTPGGTYERWQLVFFMFGSPAIFLGWNLEVTDSAGVETILVSGGGQPFGGWRVTAKQTGGNLTVNLHFGKTAPGATVTAPGTLTGPTEITANASGTKSTSPVPVGHLTVWPTANPSLPLYGDIIDPYGTTLRAPDVRPWEREAAHLRLARLCAEDGIAITVPTVAAESITRMGPQPAGTWAELTQECVDADLGILAEDGFGLAYTPRADLYNPPVALTIDLATYRVSRGDGSDVLKSTFGDEGLRNRWTAERTGGSSATASDLVSQRRGVYDDEAEFNLLDDSDLADRAAWLVRLDGTVDLKEATFPLDLAANPQHVAAWLTCGVGSRIVRTGAPAQHRPGPIDRLVDGWTETIGPRSWMVQIASSPTEPWEIATVDGPQRIGAAGSTLGAGITATATTLLITSTTANGPWTTNPSHFPLDIRIGGEQVRLSGITGTSSPQTATVAAGGRGRNGVQRAWSAGVEVDVWSPAILAL